ncbi:MAG: MATE family efflux transporter [Clostridiales bacterium]|nr:MATE family efflux transporter [Clostridiales bacterium]
MNEDFMKTKPVLPLIISMSMPMVISMLVNSLYNIVDSLFVAKISEDAITALSLVYPVQNFINAIAIGFGVGLNAVIAYYLGTKNQIKANTTATHGLIFSGIHSAVLLIGSILIMPAFLRMFTDSAAIADLGVRYSKIAFAFTPVIIFGLWFEKVFQAVGNMKITMIGLMSGCIANIILDPMLIFGIWIFPKMGIEGAALATGIGQVVTLAIYIFVFITKPINIKVGKEYISSDKKLDLKIYSIGIPAILNLALPSLLISALNAILSAFSQTYVTVLGIYYKLQTFLYLPVNGIVQGIRPLVGFNFGAREHKIVKDIYKISLSINALIMTFGTVICLAVPNKLMELFSANDQMISAGSEALRIISAGFIVSAVSVTSSGALEGLGKGLPSFIISLLRYTLIIIPAAFILSRFLGAEGVWNAFWITEAITAAVSVFIYKKISKITKQYSFTKINLCKFNHEFYIC